MKKRLKTKNDKPTLKDLDKLWAEVIKTRAEHKSEYGGIKKEQLHAHHIVGKPTYRLRYELANGVCISAGQHKFEAHHSGRSLEFRKWALKKRQVTEEYLDRLKNIIGGTDLFAIKTFLQIKLREFQLQNEQNLTNEKE